MPRKSERIVRYTADQLAERRRVGPTQSDWNEAARKPMPDGADPDDAMDDLDWVASSSLPPRKARLSLLVDSDVLEWFRARGQGYQEAINAVLRGYYERNTR